ncbi:hypothetical protein J3A64_001615 [Pseudarthrobacter sp. PvP004]|nr:hypothetical protein [Pseudarthrobacter sp. PvP004]
MPASANIIPNTTVVKVIELQKYANWAHLRGYFVEIRRLNNVVRCGFVDDATADSEIIWVAADANSPRQIFEKSEDYEVWIGTDASSHVSSAFPLRSTEK